MEASLSGGAIASFDDNVRYLQQNQQHHTHIHRMCPRYLHDSAIDRVSKQEAKPGYGLSSGETS